MSTSSIKLNSSKWNIQAVSGAAALGHLLRSKVLFQSRTVYSYGQLDRYVHLICRK